MNPNDVPDDMNKIKNAPQPNDAAGFSDATDTEPDAPHEKPAPVRLIQIIVERFAGAEVPTTSVIIAYYLLLSLFPLLIAVGNLLPLLNITPELVLGYLDIIVPPPVLDFLSPIITGLLQSPSGGLLSVGAIGAVWSATRGISYLQKAMNKAYGVPDANFIAKRVVSLVTIVAMMVFFAAFVLFFSIGDMLITAFIPTFPPLQAFNDILTDLKWPVTVAFIFCILVIVYKVTPDVKIKLKNTLPGAAFATIGLLALAQAFTLFLRFSAQRFSSYGALATFFVLMFWLNFSAMLVILGAVLNASISQYYHGEAEEETSRVDVAIEKGAHRLRAWVRRLMKREKRD